MSQTSSFNQFNLRYGAIVHLLLFKCSWLLLVIGQDDWLVPALLVQTACLLTLPGLPASVLPVLQIGLLGICMDNLLFTGDVLHFSNDRFPDWLMILWLAFALLLVRFRHLCLRLGIAGSALLGALTGPLSYWLGSLTGAVSFGDSPLTSLTVIMLCWSLLLPLSIKIMKHTTNLPVKIWILIIVSPFIQLSPPAWAAEQLIGETTFTVLFRKIYDAQLHTEGEEFQFSPGQAFRLSLRYHVKLPKKTIIRATLRQWQAQQVDVDDDWPNLLNTLIPDVSKNDQLILEVDENGDGFLSRNDEPPSAIPDRQFTSAFAGIWLAENSTYPELREQLMGE